MNHPKNGTCPSCGRRKRIDQNTGFIIKHYAWSPAWGGYPSTSMAAKCARKDQLPAEIRRAVIAIAMLDVK